MPTLSPMLYGTTVGLSLRSYRVTSTLLVRPTDDRLADFAAAFRRSDVPAGGFGVAWLEIPVDTAMYVGPFSQLRAYRETGRDNPAKLDVTQGAVYPGWPTSSRWMGLHPTCPWNPDLIGFVADVTLARSALAGAAVYEDCVGGRAMVTWHCLVCHHSDHGHLNYGGPVRWVSGWQAREHLKQHHTGTLETDHPRPSCRSCDRVATLRTQAGSR